MRFGAVFLFSKSHGARFGAVFIFEDRTVRCCSVFTFLESYGAVSCGVLRIIFFKNRTVRCGAVIR